MKPTCNLSKNSTFFRKLRSPVRPVVFLHFGQKRTYVSRLWLSSFANKRIIVFNVSALTGAKAGNLCEIFSDGGDQERQRVAATALAVDCGGDLLLFFPHRRNLFARIPGSGRLYAFPLFALRLAGASPDHQRVGP